MFGGFGTQPAAAPAFGSTPSVFGTAQPFGGSSGFGAPTSAAPSLFSGFGGAAASKPAGFGFGTSVFGNPTTSTSSFSFNPTTTANTSFSSAGANTGFGGSVPVGTFHFPTKSSDQTAAPAPAPQGSQSSGTAKAGGTALKPKEHVIVDQLIADVFDLEKKIRKYKELQNEAADYTLNDASEWDAEIKRFDATATKVQAQLSDTFTAIDLLRKNTARLRSYNLLSSRLSQNPAAYYSVSSSVESYFMEVLSGLRTEVEILEEELQHLENLHQDLIRPSERYNPLDIQGTYTYLSKIVNGVAVAVDEIAKVGDVVRKEVQALKGAPPPPTAQQSFLGQDVLQLSTARSLFSAGPSVASPSLQNLSAQAKSPLLQQMNTDQQFTMFNPAMRSLMRMDSVGNASKSPTGSAAVSPGASRLGQSIFGSTSPGF